MADKLTEDQLATFNSKRQAFDDANKAAKAANLDVQVKRADYELYVLSMLQLHGQDIPMGIDSATGTFVAAPRQDMPRGPRPAVGG